MSLRLQFLGDNPRGSAANSSMYEKSRLVGSSLQRHGSPAASSTFVPVEPITTVALASNPTFPVAVDASAQRVPSFCHPPFSGPKRNTGSRSEIDCKCVSRRTTDSGPAGQGQSSELFGARSKRSSRRRRHALALRIPIQTSDCGYGAIILPSSICRADCGKCCRIMPNGTRARHARSRDAIRIKAR